MLLLIKVHHDLKAYTFYYHLSLKHFLVLHILIYLLQGSFSARGQRLEANGGVLVKAEITIGNQNQWLKLGAFAFGTLNYGDIAVESGASFASYTFLKRHTVRRSGLAYGYEFFMLAGIGDNSNLLGSSISDFNATLLTNSDGGGGFQGLGFGVEKDYLPGNLEPYGIRRGQFILRSSIANHNIHAVFHNDVHIGKLFNGEGTDCASTGTLTLGFTEIRDRNEVYQLGLGIDLFTPYPDYTREPRNPLNSDDGRKNVWFTLKPFNELFYGNLFVFGHYQGINYTLSARLGVNSYKAGAYIQNTLHDGFGLNPRYPWDVRQKSKLFVEFSGSSFIDAIGDE